MRLIKHDKGSGYQLIHVKSVHSRLCSFDESAGANILDHVYPAVMLFPLSVRFNYKKCMTQSLL